MPELAKLPKVETGCSPALSAAGRRKDAETWTNWILGLSPSQFLVEGEGTWEGRCWYHERASGEYIIICVRITDVKLFYSNGTPGNAFGSTQFTVSGYPEFGRFFVDVGKLHGAERTFTFMSTEAVTTGLGKLSQQPLVLLAAVICGITLARLVVSDRGRKTFLNVKARCPAQSRSEPI